MDDKKQLEEANKEIERSKEILRKSEEKAEDTEQPEQTENQEKEQGEEGSGIFTADGKELPKIEGGYDIINPGSNFNENDIVSV
jgi:hypothetical protein